MPPVKISIRIEIDENISFMDGHYIIARFALALIVKLSFPLNHSLKS